MINWIAIVADLRAAGLTYKEIAERSGLSSAGAAHDLGSGRTASPGYEVGAKLMHCHSVAMRRLKRAKP